jgi:hypothetical protein
MIAVNPRPLHLAPAARIGRGRPTARRASYGFLALAALAASVWWGASERRALRAVPLDERAALLSRTVEDLRSHCREGRPAALDEHCRELASFAARFDECRGECEALVRPLLTPAPTR